MRYGYACFPSCTLMIQCWIFWNIIYMYIMYNHQENFSICKHRDLWDSFFIPSPHGLQEEPLALAVNEILFAVVLNNWFLYDYRNDIWFLKQFLQSNNPTLKSVLGGKETKPKCESPKVPSSFCGMIQWLNEVNLF